jgi:hypothetical protein
VGKDGDEGQCKEHVMKVSAKEHGDEGEKAYGPSGN